ncbi:MAG: hypothetical protein OXR07_03590 [Nitrospira sp.]|nr:hypothetical protein [Nitrospira sp.]
MITEYKRIEEKAWLEFGKRLIKKVDAADQGDASEKQKNFLRICQSEKGSFLEYMDDQLLSREGSIIGENEVAFAYRLTEREFLYPPQDTQKKIWETFKDLPVETRYSCGFWGYVIVRMIKDGQIEPRYLASGLNGRTATGAYMIDSALKSNDMEKINERVRRILRSMCNPAPRGKRVVFYDFYLGKAYWRWCWSHKMSSVIDLKFEQILKVLDEDYYGAFAEKMHSGRSCISSQNVLGGLLLYLNEASGKKLTSEQLKEIIDKVSYLSAWKALEMQKPASNKKEIEAIAAIVLKRKSKRKPNN